MDTPTHFDAYGYLVAWSGALLMRSKAIKAIKRSLPLAELNGRKADISWTGRFLPVVERKLVGVCILWTDVRRKVVGLTVDKKPKKTFKNRG